MPAVAPVAVGALVMVIWGATPVATRLATDELEPLLVAVLRTVVAGAIVLPIIAARGPAPPRPPRARLLLFVSAVTGFVLFPVVYTIGQERTSAMHGSMILAALPVVTGAYAVLVARRRPSGWWLVGCAFALAGEAVIITVRSGAEGQAATVTGDLLVLAAALAVAAGYVAGAYLLSLDFTSAATTMWGALLGAVALAPLMVVLLIRDGVPAGSTSAWGAVAFLAVVTSIVGYVGWYWALARGGIQRIAALQFFLPVSGLVLAALILDERLTLPLGIGAVAVIGGVAIARRG